MPGQVGPPRQLDGGNLALLHADREVSRFVYLFFCARSARTVTQLQLELQG